MSTCVPKPPPVASPPWQDARSPVPPSLSSHSPGGKVDTGFALELGLLHLGVDELGHGKGAGRSHHGGCDQRCRVYLQGQTMGLGTCIQGCAPGHATLGVPARLVSAWSSSGLFHLLRVRKMSQFFPSELAMARRATRLGGGTAGTAAITASEVLISPAV